MRVSVVFYRVERFFYRVDGDPAHQVQDADFVVGAGFSDSAERGLHYRRAYRPAVDVEVSRGVGEASAYLTDGGPVLSVDAAGEAVGRRFVCELDRLVKLIVVINVY